MRRSILSALLALSLGTLSVRSSDASVSEATQAFRSGDYAKALKLFMVEADKNDSHTWSALGYLYEQGLGTAADPAKALAWYRKAADAGNADAAYNLALLLQRHPDLASGIDWLDYMKKAATAGMDKASQSLYDWYRSQDRMLEAEATFQRALKADMGWAMAQEAMALYSRGDAASKTQALALLTSAAEKGDNMARFVLGTEAEAQGDRTKAAELYKQAADDGWLPGLYALGSLKVRGNATNEGLNLLEQAAQKGYAPAQEFLGQIYENGGGIGFSTDSAKAFHYYSMAAEGNDPRALVDLGRLYETGFGVPIDDAKAAKLYGQAASADLPEGLYNLGRLTLLGKGIAKNEKEGARLLRQAARENDIDALRDLGTMYALGDGVPRDSAQATILLRQASNLGDRAAGVQLAKLLLGRNGHVSSEIHTLLTKAADDGNAEAQLLLGNICDSTSLSDQSSREKAENWYRRSAAQNYPPALYALAMFYREDNDESTSPQVIESLLVRSANLGYRLAQYTLAQLYQQGAFGDANMKKAWKYYMLAAQAGEPAAQCALGSLWLAGDTDRAPNPNEAFRWYELAARQGYVPAQCNLARLYATGQGAAMDLKTAADWYRRAAEGGSPQGQYNLGRMLLIGMGVWRDRDQGLKWLRDAADQSYAPALNQLGVLYSQGAEGLPLDAPKALDLYLSAASQGYRTAQYNLGLLYASNQLGPQWGKAREWFAAAAAQGHPEAARHLGNLYEQGLGGPIDLPRALQCYQLALRHGATGAAEEVRRLEGRVPTVDRLPLDDHKQFQVVSDESD